MNPLQKKEIVVIDAFSTPPNRIKTLCLLLVCGLAAIASIFMGIDDNPPGGLLALLAAVAFILAFAHPWRTAKKFLFLLLASIIGIVLFIIHDIITNFIVQNTATSGTLQDLIHSSAIDALTVMFTMICAAAFIVGVIGSVVMFIRSRRHAM